MTKRYAVVAAALVLLSVLVVVATGQPPAPPAVIFGQYYFLTVTKAGAGSGTVTSDVTGINCGTACLAPYVPNTSVTLTAAPASGATFTGWTGACSGTGPCVVTLSTAQSVGATFASTQVLLTVSKTGTGAGTVTGTGINCGADCTELYNVGTVQPLTATPTGSATFTGWSGACSGSGACNVTMSAAQNVTATFTAAAAGGTLVAQCQTDFGGAATTDGQECVARYSEVIFAENWNQGRTSACMGNGSCPAKFKSPDSRFDGGYPSPFCCTPLAWNTVSTPSGAIDGLTLGHHTDGVSVTGNDCCGGWMEWNIAGRRTLFFRYYFMVLNWTMNGVTTFAQQNKIVETKAQGGGGASDQFFLGHYSTNGEFHVVRDGVGCPPYCVGASGSSVMTQNIGSKVFAARGQWYCMEFGVTMNTQTGAVLNDDGQFQGWINDVQKYDYPNTSFVHYAAGGPQNLGFFRFTNAGLIMNPGDHAVGDRYVVDRIVIATSRIGC